MQITALHTGTVRVKESFLFAREGWRRQLSLFLPGAFSDPLPIHAWLIEHAGQRILVDAGETHTVKNVPFARFAVEPGDELPAALAGAGISASDLDLVVLTHMHGDHMDGAIHLGDRPMLVTAAELEWAASLQSRIFAKLLRQPIPRDVRFAPLPLEDGPYGGFAASQDLTGDGRVILVATPGHTPGHASVICVDDDGHHVMLAGDATDTLEQLESRRPDAVGPDPAVHRETLGRISAYAREHPLVYLPSHDPESAARLAQRQTV